MLTNLCVLSDEELDREVQRVAAVERHVTADLIGLLIEVERRGLHLTLGFSSPFAYCTRVLKLSDHAAYNRIQAARVARRIPRILDLLKEGALTLSTVNLLGPHLTDETTDSFLDGARFKSTREVERMIATAFPAPDIATTIRAVPVSTATPNTADVPLSTDSMRTVSPPVCVERAALQLPSIVPGSSRAVIAPIAPTRFLLRVTLSEQTERKLRDARALLRHSIPDGDVDEILNRALTLLLDEVARTKLGRSKKPRPGSMSAPATGRQIPRAVRREVWARDGGRCVFRGTNGVCGETAFLELHHVIPFAAGGPTTVANLELRCRAHNAYEATVFFGKRDTTRHAPS